MDRNYFKYYSTKVLVGGFLPTCQCVSCPPKQCDQMLDYLLYLATGNLPNSIKIAKLDSNSCQIWFKELSNAKKASQNCQNTFSILPKWRNFAKSGHTVLEMHLNLLNKTTFEAKFEGVGEELAWECCTFCCRHCRRCRCQSRCCCCCCRCCCLSAWPSVRTGDKSWAKWTLLYSESTFPVTTLDLKSFKDFYR